jgi:hypothetical protein
MTSAVWVYAMRCKWVACYTDGMEMAEGLTVVSMMHTAIVIAQSVQRWATGWTIEVLGFDSRRGLGIFLFTTASRTALEPTQPPIQWVPGALSLGVKRPGREADHSPISSAEVKEWMELYLHSPNIPSWRGSQLMHRNNFTFTFYTSDFLEIVELCKSTV